MAVTRGPTTRRVAYTYDPETGNYSYGLQHPMKASLARHSRGQGHSQSTRRAKGRGRAHCEAAAVPLGLHCAVAPDPLSARTSSPSSPRPCAMVRSPTRSPTACEWLTT